MKKETHEMISRLEKLGFSYEEAMQLRRISLTLQRWFEMECGTENDSGTSISIERDEKTEKPFQRMQYQSPHGWVDKVYPVSDREAGARKRLAAILERHRRFVAYVQTDPRGASLYILSRKDVKGQNIEQIYNLGTCVY